MVDSAPPRLVVGISGASGVILGVRVLDACRDLGVETHLVISRAAALTLAHETPLSLPELMAKATLSHKVGDVGAAIASGSFPPGAMLPSETDLATRMGVSIGTLRRAVDDLAAEHLLVRRQGRGTFVTPHPAPRPAEVPRPREHARGCGQPRPARSVPP